MAEDIVQRLGFDTGDSISNIEALKSALEKLNISLASSASAIRNLNTSGSGFDKALADLTGKIDQMAQKIESGFSNIKPPQINFDTSAALSQINQLTTAWGRISTSAPTAFKQQFATMKAGLADYVATNNLSKDQVIQAFAGTLTGSTPAIEGLKTKVGELKTAFNTAATTAQTSATKIGGFFAQLGRIVAFRAIISLLNDLQQGMADGVQSAADFTQRIGQIGAIMDDTSLSLGKVRQAMFETSAQFARPLGETTLAFYQTMQNQVGGAAESLYVFQQAAKLAAANNAPLNDSVNLITAAIKGWNLNVAEAGNLSGMFFEAIKIGRMEASDLADILGRVGPTARQMGISIEEAMGAVAIMTQQGTKASTAVTQLNAIMTALIKPTKDLKAVMIQKWGVENAEQAIAKFGGLMGVLRALEQLTGGTSNEMAKFTANVRAIRAEMGLLGPNADAADEAIRRLKTATVETADAASKMVLDTAGGQYKKSVVELANAWTQMGEKMLGVSTIFNKFKTALIDWASGGSAQVLILGAGIAGVVVFLKAYAVAMGVATVATAKWVAAMALAHPLIAAFIAGAVIGQAINSFLGDSTTKMKAYFDELDVKIKANTETHNQEIIKQTQAVTDGYKQRLQVAIGSISTIVKMYQPEVDAVKRTQSAIFTTVKQRFDSVIALEQGYIQKLVNAEAEAAQKIIALRANITAREGAIKDKEFNNDLARWNQEFQAQQQLARGDQLRSEALSKLSSAKTPEDIKLVEELLARSQAYYDKASAAAKQEQFAQQAKTKSVQIDKDRVTLEEKQISLLEKESGSRSTQISQAQALLTNTTELFKQYEDGLKKISSAKTPGEMQKGAELVTKSWEGLMQIIAKQSPQATDFLGLSKIHNEIVAQLKDLPALNLKVAVDMNSLNAQLQKPMQSMSAQLQKLIGEKGWVDPGNAILEARMKLTENLVKTTEAIAKVQAAGKEIQTEVEATTSKLPGGNNLDQYIAKLKDLAPSLSPILDNLQATLKKIMATDPTDVESFRKSFSELSKIVDAFKEQNKGAFGIKLSGQFGADFIAAMDKIKLDMMKKTEEMNNMNPIQLKLDKSKYESDIQTLENQLEPLRAQAVSVGQAFEVLPQSIAATTPLIPPMSVAFNAVSQSIGNAAVQCQNLEQAATRALQKIQAAVASAASAGSMNVAYGGIIHRAAGGPVPRWTDTIPAMLSPHEVVVNATAARQFAPQLQSMNAGSQPVFRDRGGAVTNVGDINVTVNGGDTAQQTLSAIGRGLQRQIKRKILKLN